jgi:hypothetical protein
MNDVVEVKLGHGLRLTKSVTDGVWLHFDDGFQKAGIKLAQGDVVFSAIDNWANQQFNKPSLLRRFYNWLKRIASAVFAAIAATTKNGREVQ